MPLPDVDVVHDLNERPWPWADNTIDEIWAKDVLEHLPNTLGTMEELYRITKPGASVYIAVPYWNSWEAITDPTHVRQFNEFTFNFFDPTKSQCQERPYYSNARFIIDRLGFGVQLTPYLHTETRLFWKFPGGIFPWKYTIFFHPVPKWILGFLGSHFSNIITGLEVYLKRYE
jgi:SAM-dependent methyltransferase